MPSSTKLSMSVCASVSTRVRPTRWCAAPWFFPTASARTVRVLVFAKGEKAQEAQAAGADHVGADDLVAKIQEGWYRF